jgi:hypothetical protein
MKSIRIASTVKHVEEGNEHVTTLRIQEILSEHRTTLIMGILNDLPSYVEYRFHTRVDRDMLTGLKDKLFELSNSKVELKRYKKVVEEIIANSNYRVPSKAFFNEIDSVLDALLHPTQMQLLR